LLSSEEKTPKKKKRQKRRKKGKSKAGTNKISRRIRKTKPCTQKATECALGYHKMPKCRKETKIRENRH